MSPCIGPPSSIASANSCPRLRGLHHPVWESPYACGPGAPCSGVFKHKTLTGSRSEPMCMKKHVGLMGRSGPNVSQRLP